MTRRWLPRGSLLAASLLALGGAILRWRCTSGPYRWFRGQADTKLKRPVASAEAASVSTSSPSAQSEEMPQEVHHLASTPQLDQPEEFSNDAGSTDKQQTDPAAPTLSRRLEAWGPYRRWQAFLYNRQDHLEVWKERDPRENREGRLPDGETVTVPAIWVAELYTPSTVSGLLDGLRNLGWEHGRSRDDSLLEWMSDVREGRRAGWTSLGLVTTREDRWLMTERVAPLPNGVRAMLPRLTSLTPSMTALLCCFVLDDDCAASLNPLLRQDYSTYVEKRPYGLWDVILYLAGRKEVRFGGSVLSPDLQRRTASQEALDSLEHRCSAWIAEHLPGAFSSGPQCGTHPSAALVVAEQEAPLTTAVDHVQAFDGIGLNRSYRAWHTDELSGVRISIADSWSSPNPRLLFAGRRRDMAPRKPGYPDPESDWTLAQHTDNYVKGLLSRWAISCLLDGYHNQLLVLRDHTASDLDHSPIRELRQLRELARTQMLDVLAVTSEIVTFAADNRWYRHDVIEPVATPESGTARMELVPELQEGQSRRSLQMRDEADRLLKSLSLSAEMTQTISNIRVQRLLVALTLASVTAAVIAVMVTLGAN